MWAMVNIQPRQRGRKPKLQEPERSEMLRAYADDPSVPVKELAARYGISHQTLYAELQKQKAGDALTGDPAALNPLETNLSGIEPDQDTSPDLKAKEDTNG